MSKPAPPIRLTFRPEGQAFERAKRIADRRGQSMEQYLLSCIEEGHKILEARALVAEDLEVPTVWRRGMVPILKE